MMAFTTASKEGDFWCSNHGGHKLNLGTGHRRTDHPMLDMDGSSVTNTTWGVFLKPPPLV